MAYAAIGVAAPILVWIALEAGGTVPRMFMPGPLEVIARFWNWILNEGFAADFTISVQRVTLGFLASLALALPLGLLAGAFKPAEALLEPAMDFIRYMPAVAFVPLMMLWCGVGEGSKIAIIFAGTFFQMVLMFADDVRKVPMAQIEAAQTMGATRREIIYKVIFPSAAPAMLTTCRITLGWAWTYLVVAEIVAANRQDFRRPDRHRHHWPAAGPTAARPAPRPLSLSERTLSHDQSHRNSPPHEELRGPRR
jgi:NitT/TauT family transport system permease protein